MTNLILTTAVWLLAAFVWGWNARCWVELNRLKNIKKYSFKLATGTNSYLPNGKQILLEPGKWYTIDPIMGFISKDGE
jgi:hypothetical protein